MPTSAWFKPRISRLEFRLPVQPLGAVREPFESLALSPDDRNVACMALDHCMHRWESFPWREEDYARKEEGGRQKEESSESGPHTEWAAKVRHYARNYWRERLQAELHGVEGESAEPRVIEVPIDRALLPRRDPRAGGQQLDLTDFYTGELGETFHGKVAGMSDHDDDLAELPVGLMELGGVEFDIRGVIQLRRAEPLGGAWELATLDDPVRVDGIPIPQEARSCGRPQASLFRSRSALPKTCTGSSSSSAGNRFNLHRPSRLGSDLDI